MNVFKLTQVVSTWMIIFKCTHPYALKLIWQHPISDRLQCLEQCFNTTELSIHLVCGLGSINLKRCLCLPLRNRDFGEYNSNPEGFCSSTSGTCAAVSSKMTPFPPHKISHFFHFSEKQPEKGVRDKLEIQIFDILEPTWPTWMGRVSFWVRPFLGRVTALRRTPYLPFLLTERQNFHF